MCSIVLFFCVLVFCDVFIVTFSFGGMMESYHEKVLRTVRGGRGGGCGVGRREK
jgi:hypothetical protein